MSESREGVIATSRERVGGADWWSKILTTVVGAGAVGFFLQWQAVQTSQTVQALQYDHLVAQIVELKDKVVAIEGRSGDRWTKSHQEAWWDKESAKIAKAIDKLDRRLEDLESELGDHATLPWHREAGAEHAETKRRVSRLEAEWKQLVADFAALAKELRERSK